MAAKKTADGFDAGLHSAGSFSKVSQSKKRERSGELQGMDSQYSGENAETVYRDKRGRKLDMLTEYMRQQSVEENTKAKLEKAQYEWGKGAVQKKERADYAKELQEIANEPFARSVDDPKLERIKKAAVREGDPMQEYFAKLNEKKEQHEKSSDNLTGGNSSTSGSSATNGVDGSQAQHQEKKKKSTKPPYKGPVPLPNRFGIRPGYRWDAVDRGTGYEQKMLKIINDKRSYKEDEYKWSVSDL